MQYNNTRIETLFILFSIFLNFSIGSLGTHLLISYDFVWCRVRLNYSIDIRLSLHLLIDHCLQKVMVCVSIQGLLLLSFRALVEIELFDHFTMSVSLIATPFTAEVDS